MTIRSKDIVIFLLHRNIIVGKTTALESKDEDFCPFCDSESLVVVTEQIGSLHLLFI